MVDRARRRLLPAALALAGVLVGLLLVGRTVTRLGSPDPPATAPAAAQARVAPSDGLDGAVETPALPAPRRAASPTPGALAGFLVVVDPGHNGRNGRHLQEISRQVDAGGLTKDCNTTGTATANGVPESAITWALAVDVRMRLEALGAEVLLTRADDEGWGPCVDERGLVAARAGADVLLSIHADGADRADHGFHVIAPGHVRGHTEGTVEPSHALARAVRDALRDVAGLTPSSYAGVEGLDVRTDLGTLNRARVPAVMVECGNLRNPSDAALLTSPEGRGRLAEALVTALTTYSRR